MNHRIHSKRQRRRAGHAICCRPNPLGCRRYLLKRGYNFATKHMQNACGKILLNLHPKKKNIEPQTVARSSLYPYTSLDSIDELGIIISKLQKHPFNLDQLRQIQDVISDRMRIDIISRVPYEIALYIVSFLSPKDLCSAAQVCRSWRTVCEDSRLWREKCKEENLIDDVDTFSALFKRRLRIKQINQANIVTRIIQGSEGKISWKNYYLEHIHVLNNWKTRNFSILEPLIVRNPKRRITPKHRRRQVPKSGYVRTDPIRLRNRHLMSGCSSEDESDSDDPNNTFEFIETPNSTRPRAHLMQLRCHEEAVITCLQFNPRTNIIVSGSDDHTLKVWSSESGRCIAELVGHEGGVWSSQLSPEDVVVSGSTDRTLRVWNAYKGKLLFTLYGHTSTVRCLALYGNQVVSGSRDTTLRLWDYKRGNCVHVFTGHSAAVRCIEFKNDLIVSGAYDSLVMVWDAKAGTCIHALECHHSRIYSLQFDGQTIASGSLDSTICIWNAMTGELRHQLEGHTSLTSKMQLRGNLLVSANADSYCKVWDINTGVCLQTLGGENKHTSAITSVHFDQNHVITSSDDGTVKLWDIKTGEFVRDLIVLPTASQGGVVWRIRASYLKLICAVGSRTELEDPHLLVLDFSS